MKPLMELPIKQMVHHKGERAKKLVGFEFKGLQHRRLAIRESVQQSSKCCQALQQRQQ